MRVKPFLLLVLEPLPDAVHQIWVAQYLKCF